MEEQRTRKPNKTVEERRADIQKKMSFHKDAIYKLQIKLDNLNNPKHVRRSARLKLLDEKIESGVLSKEEAILLGWKE